MTEATGSQSKVTPQWCSLFTAWEIIVLNKRCKYHKGLFALEHHFCNNTNPLHWLYSFRLAVVAATVLVQEQSSTHCQDPWRMTVYTASRLRKIPNHVKNKPRFRQLEVSCVKILHHNYYTAILCEHTEAQKWSCPKGFDQASISFHMLFVC